MIKKKITKVYVVGGAINYARFLNDIELVDNLEDANIVIFTGGEDIDPSLYGRQKDKSTYSNIKRDKYEIEVFKQIKPSQLCVGVCRGSQFMAIMNGGILIQDVTNHALFETHSIITKDNCVFDITSTHHQMQYPYNLPSEDYTMIAVSGERRSCHYIGLNDEEIYDVLDKGEPEIVLYHKKDMPKCLAIQGHPEMMRKNAPVVEWLNELITKLLKNKK